MGFDPVFFSRLQFAFTIIFHIVFPTFTIGLSAYIAILMVVWQRSGRERYRRLARFWTKILAISFVLGVVSGVVLSYEIATTWGRFSRFAWDILGPLWGYEVLTVVFLEATFLSVLLFGWGRLPGWLQTAAAIALAVGAALSAFWIVAANSWMHTPTGYAVHDGIASPLNWWAIIFSPSFPYRLAHVLNAAYLTAGFVVLAVGARYRLAGRYLNQGRTMMYMAIMLLAVLAPLQLFLGDQHGLNTLKYQPMKIAAMEAHWNTGPGDFQLFAWPDEKAETNDWPVSIPNGASLVLTHRLSGSFPGLKEVPPQDRPPVPTVFFAFRVMLAVGAYMIAAALAGAWLLWSGILFETRWYLQIVARTWWVGFVGLIAGWVVTESGRQPWIVYGVMRTAEIAAPLSSTTLATSLALIALFYGILFAAALYYIRRLIEDGPYNPTLRALQAALPRGTPASDTGRGALFPH